MFYIIVNPTAGANLSQTNIKIVTKYLKKNNLQYLVYFAEKEEDIPEYINTICKDSAPDLIIVGGDGTIHKTINSIPDLSKVKIGIIPSGKNNSFAKSIGLSCDPFKAIETIIQNHIEKYDYFTCNETKICSCLAFGAVETIKHEKLEEKNTVPSTFDYIKEIKKYEPIQINFFGNEIKEKDVVVLETYICNGNFDDKKIVSPLSNVQDGLTNVICISANEKNKYSDYFHIKKGKHIYNTQNKTFWASNFNLTSSQTPIKAMVDGEFYEFSQLSIKTIPEGLNIFTEE